MNNLCAQTYAKDGGLKADRTELLRLPPAWAAAKLRAIVDSAEPTIYTTERAGVKELIMLLPWYRAACSRRAGAP